MSIKKYNIYCFSKSSEKKTTDNKKSKIAKYTKLISLKKEIFCFIALISVMAGIQLFFAIPKGHTVSELTSEKNNLQISEKKPELSGLNTDEQGKESIKNLIETCENNFNSMDLSLEQLDLERLSLAYQKVDQGEKPIKKISRMLNSGETIYELLVKEGILPCEILRLGEKVQSVVDISRLNAGVRFTIHCDSEGKIVQFDYQPNKLDAYYIKIPDNELSGIEVKKEEIFREIICLEGEINSSLYQAMMEFCDSGQLAVQLAEIFAWDIDFLTECQKGDTFKLLVERQYRGDFYRWGDILAAVYEGAMLSTHTAVLFQDPSGSSDYYDKDGRCLRKAFLRAPLNYKYISSYYTENRYHPILRINRPHLAIDYAAPTGTPVVSIGAGTVITRRYDQGGYGNYVEVKHPNGYVTGYGHLSKFAQSLKVGKRIEQGEIIGYVGATGLATGPHLDFSISRDGKRFDFLKLELPPTSSVSEEYLPDFELVKDNYLSLLRDNF